MKPKQIIVLAIILGILIVAIAIQKTRKPPELQTEEYSTLDFSFDPAPAAKIIIQKGEEKLIELSKEESVWKVSSFYNARADQQKIDNFLKQVKEAKGELRGKDKSLFSDFKISDEEAYQIVISDQNGAPLSHLYVGAKKAGSSSFIRKANSEAVYFTNTDLFGAMGFWQDPEKDRPKSDHWVFLKPLDFEVDQVGRLEVKCFQDGKETVAAGVFRETNPDDPTKKQWKYLRSDLPFAIDPEKVKQFFSSASSWGASQVLDPKAKDYGFLKPVLQMKMALEGQKEIVVTATKAGETQNVYLQVSTEPVVFQFAEYYFKSMNVDDSKFFVTNPLGIEGPEKIEKLAVKTPEKSLGFTPKEKKWDSLVNYLNNDLKNITVTRLLFDSADQKKAQSARNSLEIVKEGTAPVILAVGELLNGTEKEYAAQLSNNTQPFAISEAAFKSLFENLDRLNEPKS